VKAKCGICGAERERDKCVVLVTTPTEAAAIRKMGREPEKEYVYCNPCYRVVTDREQGARLMQGLIQTRLRTSGSPKAEALSKRMYEMMINRSRKALS
jgi:hypothetical protein